MNDSPISPEAVAQMVADRKDAMSIQDALETLSAMASVQDGYAKKATDPGLRIIHKANAKAQRAVVATVTTIAAENATLRAERDAAQSELDDCIASDWPIWAKQIYNTLKEFGYRYDHFDGIDLPEDVSEFLRGFPENAASELMEQRDDALQELATLRASEAAANARADQAWDAALVEAAGTLEVQALDTDAQAKRFRGGSDPWADRTARSRALRNSADAILALRDKPAPAVTAPITTVQDAARVLLSDADAVLDLSIEIMRNRKPNNGNVMGYQPAVVAALRAIAGGGDE